MPNNTYDLEESDTEESFNFPPPQRKISTQPYDLSVQTLVEQWDSELLTIPEIQREYMWDNGRSSRLIESLILNIPVPPLYFAETEQARFEIIDGHQRVKSIARFINNEFALSGLRVLSEYKGQRFHQLPSREQRFLNTRSLRVIIISHESHPNMKFEVFERLNTGGVTLNAQELRNSLYRGSLNDTLKQLVGNSHFRRCIGTREPRRRMVDEELVLRFFAMHDQLRKYRPPLKRFLNEYMNSNRLRDENWLERRRDCFEATLEQIDQVLGEQAFRLIDSKGRPLTDERGRPLPRGVNRALFDAQAMAFSWITPESDLNSGAVLLKISEALQREDFQDAVRRATGDRTRLFLRIELMVAALKMADVELDSPKLVP